MTATHISTRQQSQSAGQPMRIEQGGVCFMIERYSMRRREGSPGIPCSTGAPAFPERMPRPRMLCPRETRCYFEFPSCQASHFAHRTQRRESCDTASDGKRPRAAACVQNDLRWRAGGQSMTRGPHSCRDDREESAILAAVVQALNE